jgi:hypothetical protein
MTPEHRIWRLIAAITLLGAFAAFSWKGFPALAGFLLGASGSALNFRALKRFTDSVGGDRLPTSTGLFLAARYLLFLLVGCAILLVSRASLAAAAVGLLVAVAAVIVEILIELITNARA